MCKPYLSYVKINPNTALTLTGSCLKYCDNLLDQQLHYKYTVYKYWSVANTDVDIQEKWYPYASNDSYTGQTTADLTAFTKLFQDNPDTHIWKFTLEAKAMSAETGVAKGASSLIVYINQVPTSGTCSISPLSGTSVSTVFTIDCANWLDPDGTIFKYNFYAYLLDDQLKLGLGSSSNGALFTQLPQGAIYDSNRIYISVEIVDNDDGVAYYDLTTTPVSVNTNKTSVSGLMSDFINLNRQASPNRLLYEGESQRSIQLLLTIASTLNDQSMSDKSGLQASNDSNLVAVPQM